jgi:hypothetical protein
MFCAMQRTVAALANISANIYDIVKVCANYVLVVFVLKMCDQLMWNVLLYSKGNKSIKEKKSMYLKLLSQSLAVLLTLLCKGLVISLTKQSQNSAVSLPLLSHWPCIFVHMWPCIKHAQGHVSKCIWLHIRVHMYLFIRAKSLFKICLTQPPSSFWPF